MSTQKVIEVKVQGADLLDIKDMVPIQGALKSLSTQRKDELKREIVKEGFKFAFNIWKDGKENKILGGTQRWTALQELRKEGVVVPKLPVNWIKAKNLKDAKKTILDDIRRYGKVTEQGMMDFLSDHLLTPEELAEMDFGDFNVVDFIEKHMVTVDDLAIDEGAHLDVPSGGTSDVYSQVRMVQLFFNETTQKEFLEKIETLQKHFNTNNVTDTVLEVVRESHSSYTANAQ